MENVTLGQIAEAITICTVIVTAICGIIKSIQYWYNSSINGRVKKLEQDVSGLKIVKEKYDKVVLDSKEERLIIIRGLMACIDGLHQVGANGKTTETLKELENYMLKKSHE